MIFFLRFVGFFFHPIFRLLLLAVKYFFFPVLVYMNTLCPVTIFICLPTTCPACGIKSLYVCTLQETTKQSAILSALTGSCAFFFFFFGNVGGKTTDEKIERGGGGNGEREGNEEGKRACHISFIPELI